MNIFILGLVGCIVLYLAYHFYPSIKEQYEILSQTKKVIALVAIVFILMGMVYTIRNDKQKRFFFRGTLPEYYNDEEINRYYDRRVQSTFTDAHETGKDRSYFLRLVEIAKKNDKLNPNNEYEAGQVLEFIRGSYGNVRKLLSVGSLTESFEDMGISNRRQTSNTATDTYSRLQNVEKMVTTAKFNDQRIIEFEKPTNTMSLTIP